MWNAERSFASPLGYGGKTDLYSQQWVIDVKTKDGNLEDAKTWDDHALQLAAYRHGLGVQSARCGDQQRQADDPGHGSTRPVAVRAASAAFPGVAPLVIASEARPDRPRARHRRTDGPHRAALVPRN